MIDWFSWCVIGGLNVEFWVKSEVCLLMVDRNW